MQTVLITLYIVVGTLAACAIVFAFVAGADSGAR